MKKIDLRCLENVFSYKTTQVVCIRSKIVWVRKMNVDQTGLKPREEKVTLEMRFSLFQWVNEQSEKNRLEIPSPRDLS